MRKIKQRKTPQMPAVFAFSTHNHRKSHCAESDNKTTQKPWIAARPLAARVARNDGWRVFNSF